MQSLLPEASWNLPFYLVVFVLSSILMIWALGRMENKGLEGTALGTLVMPYCSGLSNLIFAWHMGLRGPSEAHLVMENCLVNNATNLTLLIGLPALIWGMALLPPKKNARKKETQIIAEQQHHLNRLSLLLTLVAALFFSGGLWALAGDGALTRREGWILVGAFLFWQVFQVFDVMKYNLVQKRKQPKSILLDGLLVMAGGYLMFDSIDWLVNSIMDMGEGFMGRGGIGWLSGWLMVLPNAFLAFYYARKKRSDIAYSSQIGDGHICIPLCIGVYALFVDQAVLPKANFDLFMGIITGSVLLHIGFVLFLGRLPRWFGALLVVAYGYFLTQGLLGT